MAQGEWCGAASRAEGRAVTALQAVPHTGPPIASSAVSEKIVAEEAAALGLGKGATFARKVHLPREHYRSAKVPLADCSVCGNASPEELPRCPFCGEVELADAQPAETPETPAEPTPETPAEPSWPDCITWGPALRARASAPRDYVIGGVAERGDVVMLLGKEESGKSMACADLAVAMLHGGQWHGFDIKPCLQRARALCRGRGVDR